MSNTLIMLHFIFILLNEKVTTMQSTFDSHSLFQQKNVNYDIYEFYVCSKRTLDWSGIVKPKLFYVPRIHSHNNHKTTVIKQQPYFSLHFLT